jgi:hypothetical protein
MTTLFSINFDTTPPADETTATTAAHTSGGAGTGMPTITNPGTNGAGVKWDSDTPHTGTRSLRVDAGNPTVFTAFNPYESGSNMAHLYARWYMRVKNAPASNMTVASVRSASALIAGCQFLTTGAVRMRDGTSTVDTSVPVFDPMEWFGVEWHIDDGANTQTMHIFDGTFSDIRDTLTGAFTSTAGIRQLQLGNITGWDNSQTVWYDDIVVTDDAFPGGLGSPDTTDTGWRFPNGGGWDNGKILLPDGLGGWA